MSGIEVTELPHLTTLRLRVRQDALGRYRQHRAKKVPHEIARNMAIAQTRQIDYPTLSARRIGIELDRAIEDDQTRGILEGWK